MTSRLKENWSISQLLWSRLLHLYFRVSRGLTLGVRAVVRSNEGKFLLVRHTYTSGWHFPGGGVERGEAVEGALRKELLQETQLELVGKPLLHGVFFNEAVSKRDHVFTFICDVVGELPDRPGSLEIAELRYFGLDELPDGVDPGTERRMREIDEGRSPSAVW